MKYRIKENLKHLVDPYIRGCDFDKDLHGIFSYPGKNSGIPIDSGLTDEMFEPIEERIEVRFVEVKQVEHNVLEAILRLTNTNEINPSIFRDRMFKALNNELKDNDQIIELVNEWLKSHDLGQLAKIDNDVVGINTYQSIESFKNFIESKSVKE